MKPATHSSQINDGLPSIRRYTSWADLPQNEQYNVGVLSSCDLFELSEGIILCLSIRQGVIQDSPVCVWEPDPRVAVFGWFPVYFCPGFAAPQPYIRRFMCCRCQ